MGVMFDIKVYDYNAVLNYRTDLSVTKDKDKEQRKRQQKEQLNLGPNSITKKNRKYPYKSLNSLNLTV